MLSCASSIAAYVSSSKSSSDSGSRSASKAPPVGSIPVLIYSSHAGSLYMFLTVI